MKQVRLVLAVCALLTLSGCFDLLHEYWFSPDGSARVVVDVGLPRAVLHLAGEDLVLLLREEARHAEAALREDPAVTSLRFRDYVERDQHHLVWELEVNDAARLPELFGAARARRLAEKGEAIPSLDLSLEKTALGDQVFLLRMAPPAAPDTGAANIESRFSARKLTDAMLGKPHLTVRVNGPSIGATNGSLSGKRDQVEWRIPLSDLLAEGTPPVELRAVVNTGAPLWLWGVVLGVPALLLWAAVAAMKRRRRHSAPG